jgi:hypothetical protein
LRSKVKNKRLAGIAAFEALIDSPNETYSARVVRTTLALNLLEFDVARMYGDDLDTAEATANLFAAFSRVRGVAVARIVEATLERAIDDLLPNAPGVARPYQHASRPSLATARSVMLVTALAPTNQALVLPNLEPITAALCAVARDDIRAVRDTGVAALSTIIDVCAADDLPDISDPPPTSSLATVFAIITRELDVHLEPLVALACAGSPLPDSSVSAVVGSLVIIGSLLDNFALRTLILAPPSPQNGNVDVYRTKLATRALAFQHARSSAVRLAVADVLPQLAAADPDRFSTDGFLEQSFDFLVRSASTTSTAVRERAEAVIALGRVARKVGAERFADYLDRALELSSFLLRERVVGSANGGRGSGGVSGRDSQGFPIVPPAIALGFIRRLAKVSGISNPCFISHVRHGLLAKMFATGFTVALVSALKRVILVIPVLDKYIQEMLLQNVAEVLNPESVGDADGCSSEPLFVPRTSANTTPGFVSALSESCADGSEKRAIVAVPDVVYDDLEIAMDADGPMFFSVDPDDGTDGGRDVNADSGPLVRCRSSGSAISGPPADSQLIALDTLATFGFSVLPVSRLAWFTNSKVIGYVESVSVRVRRLAVRACATLMLSAAEQCVREHERTGIMAYLRGEVFIILLQLTAIAAVDPSRRVRFTALSSLESPVFIPFLAQPETLGHLSSCLLHAEGQEWCDCPLHCAELDVGLDDRPALLYCDICRNEDSGRTPDADSHSGLHRSC